MRGWERIAYGLLAVYALVCLVGIASRYHRCHAPISAELWIKP